MSALKKDKQKVLGEFFDDERIKTFLDDPYSSDYQLLERAYRGMIAENFTSFVGFFIAAGKDINAHNADGETFLQTIQNHKPAQEYIEALTQSGAQ